MDLNFHDSEEFILWRIPLKEAQKSLGKGHILDIKEVTTWQPWIIINRILDTKLFKRQRKKMRLPFHFPYQTYTYL